MRFLNLFKKESDYCKVLKVYINNLLLEDTDNEIILKKINEHIFIKLSVIINNAVYFDEELNENKLELIVQLRNYSLERIGKLLTNLKSLKESETKHERNKAKQIINSPCQWVIDETINSANIYFMETNSHESNKLELVKMMMRLNQKYLESYLKNSYFNPNLFDELLSDFWQNLEKYILNREYEDLNEGLKNNFTAWMKVTMNNLYSKIKKGKKNDQKTESIESEALLNVRAEEFEEHEYDYRNYIPTLGIFLLKENQKSCILKRYVCNDIEGELTYREVAKELGMDWNTVRVSIQNGRDRLSHMMENHYKGNFSIDFDGMNYSKSLRIVEVENSNEENEYKLLKPALVLLLTKERETFQSELLGKGETLEKGKEKYKNMIVGYRKVQDCFNSKLS